MSGAILAVDTAAPVVGVATCLPGPDGALMEWSARAVRGADALLAPAIQEQLAWIDTLGVPLEAVVVSVGPGSFTGLRVGVASALGVALARGVPVLAVSSLWARACLVEGPVLALLDARKERVYVGRFELGPDGLPAALGAEGDLPLDEALVGGVLPVAGEGALVFAEELERAGFIPMAEADRSPVGALARRCRPRLTEAVDAGAVALRYLRPPDARLPGTPS